MTLPNFLIVGAEKAGTTSLAATLATHPSVFMSDPKELRFFSYHNWDKGVDWYGRHFAKADGFRAIGEASPSYTQAPLSPEVPERIRATLGDIRFVYVVRDPIARLISNYRHGLVYGWFAPGTSLKEAMGMTELLRAGSLYYSQIERFLSISSREQWHVLALEELIAQPTPTLDDLLRFLDVEPTPKLVLSHDNATDDRDVVSSRMRRLAVLGRVLPPPIRELTARAAHRLVGRTAPAPAIDPDHRRDLLELFRPEVEHLSKFVGRDFMSLWDLG